MFRLTRSGDQILRGGVGRSTSRNRYWRALGAVSAIAFVLPLACGGAGAGPKPTPSTASTAQKPVGPREALVARLRDLDDGGPVLEALGTESRQDLDALVNQLPPDERRELASDNQILAARRPLLHLAAGGSHPAAHLALATSPAGADMLVIARRAAGKKKVSDIPQSLRELSRRAAVAWLRFRAPIVGSNQVLTADHFDEIAQAAETLEDWELVLAARKASVEVDPGPENLLRLSQAAARALDAELATDTLQRVPQDRAVSLRRQTSLRVNAATEATVSAEGPEQAVGPARAALALGRADHARKILEPHRGTMPGHIGLAAAWARAVGGACPRLPPHVSNALVCAAAWESSTDARDARALLDQAWKKGQGADARSVETVLALTRVLPWVYGGALQSEASGTELVDRLAKDVGATYRVSKRAEAVAPEFAGLTVFVDSLRSALAGQKRALADSKQGKVARVSLKEKDRARLMTAARDVAQENHAPRLAQPGVLAAASLLSEDEDVSQLLALLPADKILPRYRPAAAVLRGWSALSKGDRSQIVAVREELTAALSAEQDGGSELVLFLAELDVAFESSTRTRRVLAQLATRLVGEKRVPYAVRLRAGLDAAGMKAREGELKGAAAVLEGLLKARPEGLDARDVELLAVVETYLIVLRGRLAEGAEQRDYVGKLQKLVASPAGQPAAVVALQRLWLAWFEQLPVRRGCGKRKACHDALDGKLRKRHAELEPLLGSQGLTVMGQGALPLRDSQLSFKVTEELEIVPVVGFAPRLLAIEIPGAS